LPLYSIHDADLQLVEKNLTSGLNDELNSVDRLRQLATNVSGLLRGTSYKHPELENSSGYTFELISDLQEAATELQVAPATSGASAQNIEAQEESIAKQAIVDTAR